MVAVDVPIPSAKGIPTPRMAPKADPDSTVEEAVLVRGWGVASAPAGAGVGATSAAWVPTSRLGSGGCSQKDTLSFADLTQAIQCSAKHSCVTTHAHSLPHNILLR